MSRIAVLGASGFLGRRIVHRLADAGHDVVAGVRSPTQVEGARQVIEGSFDTVSGCIRLLDGCHAVVNTASISTPGTSYGKPLREVEGNLRVTAALVEALQERPGVELVYVSSGGSVYASSGPVASNEDSEVRPRSYHGAAKLASEWLISAWCDQYGGRATAVRPSNIYGPGQPAKPGFGIIPAAFNAILTERPLTLWGDGSAARDYVFVDDVADLVARATAPPQQSGLLRINAGSGESIRLVDLFDTIAEVTGRPVPRVHEPARSVDAVDIAIDSGAAKTMFGWSAATGLRDGLTKAWHAFSTHGPPRA